MRYGFLSLGVTAVMAVSVSLVGCGSPSAEQSTDNIEDVARKHASEAGPDDHAGHDHGEPAGHAHPAEGPHGGHLIELGDEEYHAELLHDENAHTVTIYILDGPAKHVVPVPAGEITLQLFRDGQFVKYVLKRVQRSGDTGDAASKFEIVDDTLCDALSHGDETPGRLQLTMNGKPYTGTIEHASHADHDHEKHNHD